MYMCVTLLGIHDVYDYNDLVGTALKLKLLTLIWAG